MDHSRRARSARAAVLHGARDLRLEKRVQVDPGLGEVSIAVRATGLCGSDLHYYSAGRNGDFAVRAPLVLGHEAAGVVTAVGPGVYGLRPGARVAIEAGIACRTCTYCTRGRYNLCKGMRFASSAARFPHLDGTLRSVMNHPAWCCHVIPDDVSLELAALAEPLSVLIHAGRRIALGSLPNESVLVFGVGAIGLLACALARARGAARVVAVDINEQRLAFAKREGFADEVFALPRPSTTSSSSSSSPSSSTSSASGSGSAHVHAHENLGGAAADACCAQPSPPSPPVARAVLDALLAGTQSTAQGLLAHFGQTDGFDVVFECTGAESAIQMSVYCAAAGGRVMLVGMGARNVYMPVSSAAVREVDVKGSFRYAGTYEEALEMLRPPPPTRAASDDEDGDEDEDVEEDEDEEEEEGEDGNDEDDVSRATSGRRPALYEQVQKLVTHRVPLEEADRAFEMLERGVDELGGLVLKIVVGPGEVRPGEVVEGLCPLAVGVAAGAGVGGAVEVPALAGEGEGEGKGTGEVLGLGLGKRNGSGQGEVEVESSSEGGEAEGDTCSEGSEAGDGL